MECRAIEAMVMPYINDELDDEELEIFLEHIKTCKDCREELEIYYTIDVGIKQLDTEMGIYNIKGALETALMLSGQRVKHIRNLRITKYVVNTLMTISLLVIFLLQLRIWMQQGFFIQ